MTADLPLWRSLLFVPATSEKFVRSAARGKADAVILDLEDSIPEAVKADARTRVAEAAAQIRSTGHDVLVRVNQPLKHTVPDLEAIIGPNIGAVVLPKTLGAPHLALIADLIDDLEAARGMTPGATAILAMVETAGALARMDEIAACPRVVALAVGSEDLALSMRMQPLPIGLQVPSALAVIATRAAGKLPIGYLGSVAAIDDLAAYRQTIAQARAFGFAGGLCVHPSQVDILNEEFAPGADEVAAARDLVADYRRATAAGLGAVRHKGRMIDRPMFDRALALLRLHERIERKAGADR